MISSSLLSDFLALIQEVNCRARVRLLLLVLLHVHAIELAIVRGLGVFLPRIKQCDDINY
jgi:hypothetical protein